MANNAIISAAARSAACDAITALFNVGGAGTIKIYTTAQPAGPGTGISGQTLLATLTFSATAFPASTAGVATASTITSETNAVLGTADWARMASGAGTAILDCTVGTSGADINFNSVSFTTGATIAITNLTLTMPAH